jgi:hypothetical protein
MNDTDVYWDAAFTYGELTCQRCGVVLSTNQDGDYEELADRAKRMGWKVEDAKTDFFVILCPICVAGKNTAPRRDQRG